MKTFYVVFLLVFGSFTAACAQHADSVRRDSLEEVVVTATRTARTQDQVPIPVSRVGASEIANRGMVRLDEILAEQTGLAIVNDHGQGIQMQGLNPDYTLILIDGEPVIGRTSGTLELSRITTMDIDRIEIVRGPASSLYGSEAMAGVINVITKEPAAGTTGTASLRYGTYQSADLSLNAAYRNKRFLASGFVNRYSSNGYSLRPESGENTVSPFAAYTASGRVSYQPGEKTRVRLSARYYDNGQDDRYSVEGRLVAGKGNERNFSIFPVIEHRFSENMHSSLRLYRSSYKTSSLLSYEDDGELYEESFFDQTFNRAEIQHDYTVHDRLILTGGAGGQYETVAATRYDKLRSFTSGYAYLQGDWTPFTRLNILAGGRYDMHSEYHAQFSPKLAASYRFSDRLTVMASAGRGYKAPDFRQLYLNFTNAVSGYSVFGYEDAYVRLAELQQQGQIDQVLIDPASLRQLDAESSVSYHIGFRYKPFPRLRWNGNFFRNQVSNLIESAPIAIKTNGQSVFSYFNLNRIYTQGAETELAYRVSDALELAGGFQYLKAYDRDAIDRIESGTVYMRDPRTGKSRPVKRSEYGGLLGRSRYMGNARVSYCADRLGMTASLRAVYRGRYGVSDLDGNGILNMAQEYMRGYTLLNASVSKLLLGDSVRLQLTANNILDFKNPEYISNLPGRLLYLGLSYTFSQ